MRIIRTVYAPFSSFVERHRAATAGLCGGLIALDILLLCVTPRMPMPVFVALSVLGAWLTVIHLVTGRFPRIGWLNFGLWLVLRLRNREEAFPRWSLLIAKILFSISILLAAVGTVYAAGTILYQVVEWLV
jgi:hypothetical protein